MNHLVIGILAHVDAGKTTLSEAMLYLSGRIRRLGRVAHQDAFLDTDTLEKERGITIFSKQAALPLEGAEVTLLDTPGHVDFSAEMERTLEKLLPWLEAEGVYLLNEYLEVYRRYARRSSRYYFYRGSLYGAREALEIWAEEHGGSGGALA